MRLAVGACVLCAALLDQVAQGQAMQTTAQAPGAGQGQKAAAENTAHLLHLLVGHSLTIPSAERIKRVSIADPTVADTLVVNPNQILVNGKSAGTTSVVIWDENDQQRIYEVDVELDIHGLEKMIKDAYPYESVSVQAQNDVVVLSGQVGTQAVADKMLEMAKASAAKAVTLLQIETPTTAEILLEVKFADVERTAMQQLGINILSLPGAKNVGAIGTGQFGPPTLTAGEPVSTTNGFNLSNLLNIFIYRPDINLAATIQALEQQDVIQILAEPNVMTESGKEASFLAGGQFPYPVVQGSGTGLTVTIVFKDYGVKLDFTPTLMADGLIHLKVKPEVSALDFSNALTISGFLIPALTTERVESEMDLRDGQSFAIAGLLDNRVTDELEKIPWIGDIPILGKLFQSRSVQKTKNELLVLVTPRVVHPLSQGQAPAGPNFPIPFMPANKTTTGDGSGAGNKK
jgi:pilus assembly protein CpaC